MEKTINKVSIGGLAIVLIIIGYLIINGLSRVKENLPEAIKEQAAITVTYENGAFNPASVRVRVGESVKFVNNQSSAIRVASNPHPIHTSYPKLESGAIAPGDSYVFTAAEKTIIRYHNHFNPGAGGEIAVE